MLTKRTIVVSVRTGVRDTIAFLSKFKPLFILIAVLININIFSYTSKILEPYLELFGVDSLGIAYLIMAISSPRIA